MPINIFERHFTPIYPGTGNICIRVTPAFASMFNTYTVDEITYVPVSEWIDANEQGKAPPIMPHHSHISVLSFVPFNILSRYFLIR